MRKPRMVFAVLAVTAMLTAACGNGAGEGGGGDGNESAGSDGKITITSPEDGASVRQPFTLKFDAGDIGATDTGKDHVHVFVDGKESDYTVVTKNSFVIKGVGTGEHTINITKQHADHSPTGDKAEITVNVTGGGGTPSESTEDERTGYDY